MATVNAVLVTNRKDKYGKSTIRLAVCHENKRRLFTLSGPTLKAKEDEWDNEQRLFKFDKLNAEKINEWNTEILSQKQNILDIINQYEKSRTPWSLQMLSERIISKPKTSLFYEIANQYIEKTRRKNQDTARTNENHQRSLIIFCGEEKYKKLTCSDINYAFIYDYFEEMLTRKNGKGLEYSTIKSHLVFIKTVLNLAIAENVASPETFPFKKRSNGQYFSLDKLKTSKTHRSLPDEYLDQILSYRAYDEHDLHWQIYIFKSCHPGLEFLNVIQLKEKDIHIGTDEYGNTGNGIKIISKQRKKTIFYLLTPLMLKILSDIKANYPLHYNRLFPILINESYNENELLKLKKSHFHLITYCKRNLIIKHNYKKQYSQTELTEFANQRFYHYGEKKALLLWRFSHSMDGINMLDMIKLKEHNIETNFNNKGETIESIRYKRSKTGVEIITPLSNDAKLILGFFKKYEHFFPKAKNYLLPILPQEYVNYNNQELIYRTRNTALDLVNRRMKIIGLKMNWPKEIAKSLSFYWARHTFAQRCLMNGASLERIQGHMGHLDIKTTEVYVSGFDVLKKAAFKDKLFANDKPAI